MCDEILTLAQAARFLQVSERTCWELARAGEIPSCRVGRQYRFSKDVLRQWVEAKHTASSKEVSDE